MDVSHLYVVWEFYRQTCIKVLVQVPPAPNPRCKFGELRILVQNTYQMTKEDALMTDNSIQKITKDRA